MKFFKYFLLILAPFFISGCAYLDQVPGEESAAPASDLALSGFKKQESLHFIVYAYDSATAAKAADIAEDVYKKIMFDANLMSFKPRDNYRITIYRDQEEYTAKTGYPRWSGGGTVTVPVGQILPTERDVRARSSIVAFETYLTRSLLAHEISHLVFNEFMSYATTEEAAQTVWLNEGLATYEEFEAYDTSVRSSFSTLSRSLLRSHAVSLEEAVKFRPIYAIPQVLGSFTLGGTRQNFTTIDVWYWQVRTLTEFLIQKQGQYNFYLFLDSLKRKRDVVAALGEAYPGRWRNLSDLEVEWRQWL